MGARKRSSIFYASDVRNAAEAAADAVEDHGLSPEQAEALAEEIEETITAFFAAVEGADDGDA